MASGWSGRECKWASSFWSDIVMSTGFEYPTTCKLFFLKSMMRFPALSATYASRIFHSGGTVQSNTFVPLFTSWIFKGTCSCRIFNVFRTPFPVIDRQMGKRRCARACIFSPSFGFAAILLFSCLYDKRRAKKITAPTRLFTFQSNRFTAEEFRIFTPQIRHGRVIVVPEEFQVSETGPLEELWHLKRIMKFRKNSIVSGRL